MQVPIAVFRKNMDSLRQPMSLEELEDIDLTASKMCKADISALAKYMKTRGLVFEDSKLTKYERFLLRAEDIYLYQLGKYNSKTRALKIASMFTGMNISASDINLWKKEDAQFAASVQEAESAFKDTLREEILSRAVFGEEVPVFDKYGNQTHSVTQKSDRLLEKMLSANCEEYKDKNVVDMSAGGGITFNVVNFATEQKEREAKVIQEKQDLIIEMADTDGPEEK